MTILKSIIILSTIILTLTKSIALGQANKKYVDSINRYIFFVDSLVNSFYKNSETKVSHSIAHHICLNGGGETNLYEDSKRLDIYQLAHSMNCDNIITDKTYYFINRKIVFVTITIHENGNKQENKKYYKNDSLVSINNSLTIPQRSIIDKDIKDGYDLLRGMK